MLTKGIEVMKYVRASAGRAGISVVFEDTNQPRHDGNTIYLPRITYRTTDLELKELMASVDHEVAHDRFSSFDVLKEKGLDPKGIVLFVWNFLEDSRINNIEAREYQGFRENWDDTSSILVENILRRARKETSAASVLTEALICWESKISAAMFPQIELAGSKNTPNEKISDVLSNYSDRLVDCQSILDKRLGTEATYQLALDILKELGEKAKDQMKAASDQLDSSKDGKAKGKSSETSGEQKLGGESESEGTPTEDDRDYQIIEIKLTPEDLDKFSISLPEDGQKMSKVGVNFKPTGSTSDDWDLTDFDKFEVINYPKKLGREKFFDKHVYASEFQKEYKTCVQESLMSQENFAQQVRRLIQIRAKVQRQYGVKKGKLDQSRLSRICFNAPGFNERVFKNKIENKTLDAAITVLVDMSGSMGGKKVFYALASTILVAEVCSVLNIPLEIIGFTDGYDAKADIVPTMFVYKSFSDLSVSSDQLKSYFAYSSNFMNGNPDGENILWAYDRIVKRKERKKLLIVMSDGSPAASKSMSGIERLTDKVIKEIEASKVDIYGLGLCSTSVQHYYKANSVVNDPQEIPSKLLELIERKIVNV